MIAISAIAWLLLVYPKQAKQGDGREIAMTLEPGLAVDEVIAQLAAQHAIEHPAAFAAYMRILGVRLREGPIVVTDRMTPGDLARRIADGLGPSAIRVTIPEGFTRFDIAARLDRYGVCKRDELLAAIARPFDEHGISAPSAEGYLFPDTYELLVGMPPADVIDRLTANFERRVKPELDAHAPALIALQRDLGIGAHEALVLASIVEKEAAVREERPVIARVFLNRLASETFLPRHRLQADPTVSYGCLIQPEASVPCRAFDGRHITRAMLDDPRNVYNTYRQEGLPPGPVCNPGLSSIRAVLEPAEHDYLYFVAQGGGRHTFSATLDDHNAAVARWREMTP